MTSRERAVRTREETNRRTGDDRRQKFELTTWPKTKKKQTKNSHLTDTTDASKYVPTYPNAPLPSWDNCNCEQRQKKKQVRASDSTYWFSFSPLSSPLLSFSSLGRPGLFFLLYPFVNNQISTLKVTQWHETCRLLILQVMRRSK